MFGTREKVFVSYSSANDGFVREEILPQLDRAKRDHWFAPKSIGGGDDWRMKLLDGLDSCDRLLVVVSKEAQESQYVKLELASATKTLLAKQAKLDARQVHRAILPVKLESRGTCGEKIAPPPSEDGTVSEVDPYLLHPYLTLVNFIAMPHNEKLNRILAAPKAKRKEVMERLGDEQQRTIRAYEEERNEAQKRLATAIRKPESLRWGFGPLGRLLVMLVNPAFQRVALAVALFLALTLFVPLGKQWANAIGWMRTAGPPLVEISADPASLLSDPIEEGEGFPVDLSEGPVRLRVRVRTEDGAGAETLVTLRPEIADDAVAIVPSLAFRENETADWREAGDEIPVDLREDRPVKLEIRAMANGKATVSHVTLPVLPRPVDVLPQEAPALAIRSESTGDWQDAGEEISLGLLPDRPVRLDIRATANGKETTSHVMLPALPAVVDGPALDVPTVTVRPETSRSWRNPGDDVPLDLREDGPTRLDIRAMANGREITTHVMLPAVPRPEPAPSLEAPTVAVRPETSRSWQDPGDALRLGLREDGPTRLEIRAMANGRETTTHVMLPARPRPDSYSPPALEDPTITVRPETSRTWLPASDDVRLGLLDDRPTRLDIRATANGREATSSIMLPARPQPAATPDPGPPSVRVRPLSREQWAKRAEGAGPDAVTDVGNERFLELRASTPDGIETRHYIKLAPPVDRIPKPSEYDPVEPRPQPVSRAPKFQVKVKDSKDPSKVGKTTAYDIEVTNNSDVAATNVLIVCHLNPRYQEYVRSSGATKGAPREHRVRFARLDRLAPGEKAAWRVVVRNTLKGEVRFRVEVTSDQVKIPVRGGEMTKVEKP